MSSSPSSTAASPPSPRIFDTPPTTPPHSQTTADCPPAPRPQLVTRSTARYFIAADLREMELLACSEGDFASIRGTSCNFVRQGGIWNLCRPNDVYHQARSSGLLLSPSSCWTQGPMRLSAAFWTQQPTTQSSGRSSPSAQHEEPQIMMRVPLSFERATLQRLRITPPPMPQERSTLQPALPIDDKAPANQADEPNAKQGKN